MICRTLGLVCKSFHQSFPEVADQSIVGVESVWVNTLQSKHCSYVSALKVKSMVSANYCSDFEYRLGIRLLGAPGQERGENVAEPRSAGLGSVPCLVRL